MSKRILFVLMICMTALCFSPLAFGQAIGSFSGTVTDKSGSSIAGASVTVTSQGTGLTRDAKTDDTGHYIVTNLPVGMYTIRVQFQGFQPAEAKDLRLQIDEAREVNFSLNPASVSSSVEVVANAVALETTNPSLGQVITSQEVAQLPLNGRDFVQLANLTPGTTVETTGSSFFTSSPTSEVAARGPFSLSVGGSRPNATDWLIDGTDNNELTAGGIGTLSSIDDIQEFKVLTYTYSAEYGTRAGPTVLLTTKSGGNDFHGSLFEFLRNTSLDAKSFFSPTKEKFNLNQFGGSIGGPIRKNKTFFFIDGEQKFQRRGIANAGLVPSDAMRSGDFTNDALGRPAGNIFNPNASAANTRFQCDATGNPIPANANGTQTPVAGGGPCNKIPGNLTDPVGQALLNLYPEPNVSGQGFNFAFAPVRKLDETKLDIRLDHNFSANDTAYARFSYDQAVSFAPGGSSPEAPFAEASAFGSNQGFQNHARNISIGETHIFTPTTVNQFNFGYNRIFNYITSTGTGSCAAANLTTANPLVVGIQNANLGCTGPAGSATCGPGQYSCGLTSLLMTGYYSIGDRGYSPFQGGTNIFSWSDTLDVVRGKHDFKFGFDIRDNQMNVGTEAFQDGFWVPLSFAYSQNIVSDVLMGLTSVALHDQTFNGPVTGRRWKIYRPYVQDDWRITRDLTLNLGVAWDLTTPISEAHNRQANYVPATNTLLVAGQNGVDEWAGVQRSWTAFEPRIGFAYKLLGSDKTVIRGGVGIFHDGAWSMGAQGLWQNPPFFAESNRFGFGCPFVTSQCAGGDPTKVTGVSIDNFPLFSGPQTSLATFPGTLFFQPTNFRLGKVQQFNINAEHQLPGNVVLTVGYAGARGSHLLVAGNNLNTFGPTNCAVGVIGCNADGTPFVPSFAPPLGNAVLVFGDYGKTIYDSLQIKAETKSSRYGLYALIGYTYSKTYDNGLSDGLGSLLSAPYFPLPNWGRLDWGLSQINLNHSFTASVIYDLPFGRGKQFGSNWNNVTNSLLGGWQLTLIEKITSGFPVPLVDSFNQSGVFFNSGGNGNNFNRPDQVKGCDKSVSNHGPLQQYINPACFVPAVGHLGDANRVPAYGPDFVNTDFSVIKQFALPRENMGLNFRAEFFNLFNHTQFGMPVNDISAPGGSFGQVQSTVNNPRLIQFALKLTF